LSFAISQMTIRDYDDALALWQRCEGVCLGEDDSKESIAAYLDRNPGLSFVARDGQRLVAVALCGHDGRRGAIRHLAVAEGHRRRGLGRALVERCLVALRQEGIRKCYLFVLACNERAIAFWQSIGWSEATPVKAMSIDTAEDS